MKHIGIGVFLVGLTIVLPGGRVAVAADDTQAGDAAQECYHTIVDAYMHGRWDELLEEVRKSNRHSRSMTSAQRKDIMYVRKTAARYRPRWWKKCKSSRNISFKASIWGRSFTANYVPSSTLGMQAAVGVRRRRIQIIVSWRPSLIDSPKSAKGRLAELHEIKQGHIGEMIVWHELGHNYITNFLPLKHVIMLYNDHNLLFHHLQEFYADMTSIYHSSPPGRLVAMMTRLDELQRYRDDEPHTRSAHVIGSLILSHILAKPQEMKESWPSIHLPSEVPDEDVELKTLIYVYKHIDPKWTLAEDRQLREFIRKTIFSQGEKVLRRRGEVRLPNKLAFRLMAGEDRRFQTRRNEWVAQQLAEAIKLGHADEELYDEEDDNDLRIEIPF